MVIVNDEIWKVGKYLEKPRRKNIRLKAYDYSQAGYYFVTICTQDRAHLFGEIVGATLCGRPHGAVEMIIKWIFEIESKFPNAKIDKYVVMPNHVHIIITLSGDHTGSPLPMIVDWFKTMTTNEYIRGVKSALFPAFNKRVWQRGYHDHVIRDEAAYLKIWEYVDTNPEKWSDDCYNELPEDHLQ